MRTIARTRAGIALTRLALAAASMLLFCPVACALNPGLEVNQYAHTAWPARERFTGTTQSIVQTADGRLWLGTEFGLLRFDGMRFSPWTPPAGERLPNSNIMALLAARDGTLWIGTIAGLASFNNGRLIHDPKFAGGPVFALLEDREGTVWVGLHGRLCAIRGGNTECSDSERGARPSPDHLGRVAVYSFFEDGEGGLWAGEAESGLWRWRPGPPKRVLPGAINSPQALAPGDHGTGLIAAIGGVLRKVGGEDSQEYTIPGMRQPSARHLLRDRNGALWIGTAQQGLLRVHDGKTSQFAHGDGLSSDSVTALFEDREGSIWVGTTDGIDRFREPAVSTISAKQGLSRRAWSVLAARDGSLWIGTQDGLDRWQQGQMTVYRFRTEPGTQSGGERNGAPREVTDTALADNSTGSLFEDQRGRIWVTSRKGAAWFENGRFTRVRGSLPVGAANAIAADQHGGVWISYAAFGQFHVVDGKVIESANWPWSDPEDARVSTVVSDPLTGGLWVGFKHDGLTYLTRPQAGMYSPIEGAGAERVWNFHRDHEGTLWAATEGGLRRIRDGHVATLTAKNGLPCDAVRWVIEDDAFSLWLYTACGLLRITRPDLEAWVSDQNRKIHTTMLDGADGVRVHALLNPYTPVVTKSPDGKIWFAHLDGVSVIDPLDLRTNKVPPPVYIEQIIADDRKYTPIRGLRLPPRVRDLSIDYTALSFVAPEKMRFRFKLEPQDQEWREVVNVRQVEYSNLSPGNYRFCVMASNNSGVWNEIGDTLEFSIAPAYYQTNLFRVASVAAFFLILLGLYRYRLYQIARQFNARLDERVEERTRIARELHDTLLQSFQAALFEFQAARNLFSKGRADAIRTLESAIGAAQGAIVEGRNAIQGLRRNPDPQAPLEQLLRIAGEELASSQVSNGKTPAFRVTVEGTAQALSPLLQDEVFQIGRELLRNAFRHASASRIEAEIRYDKRVLRLRIRDDGKGIDRKVLKDGMLPGHWGLPGIRERAKRIGARLVFWSEAGAGAEVELEVPSRIAYKKSNVRPRVALFQKDGKVS